MLFGDPRPAAALSHLRCPGMICGLTNCAHHLVVHPDAKGRARHAIVLDSQI
jgi:hypothetical protein